MGKIKHKYGTVTTLPTEGTGSGQISRDGYSFLGWYKDSTLTDGPYTTIGATEITGSRTYYANWKVSGCTVKMEVDTFGSSPIVNTYNSSGQLINSSTTEYGWNLIEFKSTNSTKNRIQLVGLDSTDCYVFLDDIIQTDPQNIWYDVDQSATEMELKLEVMSKEFNMPYVATVNSITSLDDDLSSYIIDPKIDNTVSAISFVSDNQYVFTASPGRLKGGFLYEINLCSIYDNDERIRFGHRGDDDTHIVKFGFGIEDPCTEESFEYVPFELTSGTKYKTVYSSSGMSTTTRSIRIKPLSVDLRDKEMDSQWQFGVILKDANSGCTGVTFGGRHVVTTNINNFLRYQYFGESAPSEAVCEKVKGHVCKVEMLQ